jgi:hypothetical protein
MVNLITGLIAHTTKQGKMGGVLIYPNPYCILQDADFSPKCFEMKIAEDRIPDLTKKNSDLY